MTKILAINYRDPHTGAASFVAKEVAVNSVDPSSMIVSGPARNGDGAIVNTPNVDTFTLENATGVTLLDAAEFDALVASADAEPASPETVDPAART